MTAPSDMNDWNAKIIEEFRTNDGKVGGPFAGAPMIQIPTLGAKSRTERVTPLVYFPQPDDKIVIVASEVQGADRDELWPTIVAANPGFGGYQEKTTRVIPVLLLTRAS